MTLYMAIAWVIYCLSACCAPATWYISNTVNIKDVFKNIEDAIEAAPICKLHIQNYHYEDKVTYSEDADGN